MTPNIEDLPLVSVIVPIYNCEAYLGSFLECLSDQTYPNLEIVCVNDGSTDNSMTILEKAASRDSRFKVASQPNKGAAAARNTGFRESSGEYVIFFDADDMVEPEIVEKMARAFSVDPEIDVVLCAIDEYLEEEGTYRDASWAVDSAIPSFEQFNAADIERVFEHVCGYATNKMVRRSLIDEHSLKWQEGLRIHEDMSFVQSALALSRKAYFVDEPLYHHRLRSEKDSSTNTNRNLYECIFLALEDIKDTLKKSEAFERFEQAYVNYALQQSKWKCGVVDPDVRNEALDALRNGWIERLEITGYPKEYYLNEDALAFMEEILEDGTSGKAQDAPKVNRSKNAPKHASFARRLKRLLSGKR